jgi:S-adenosylmethionine-diacylglycerol 3-amino-3-carboxypropyl transferase
MNGSADRAERLIGQIWDWRRALVLLCAMVTLLAAYQAAKVGVDNSLRIWFVEDDPQLVAYERFQQHFGNDEIVVIAFRESSGMATPAGIELLRKAERILAEIPGVDGTLSFAGALDALTALDPSLADPLFHEQALRQIRDDPRFRDRLISRDGTTAALIVRMAADGATDRARDRILSRIDAALESLQQPAHKAGIGVVYAALNRLSVHDAFALFCGAFAVMFILLWALYRRLLPAAVTMAIAAVAMIWTMGLYGAAGRSLNMVTSVMPTVILVIAVAETVHVLLHAASLGNGLPRREKISQAVGFMLRPCVLNIVTSAIGFATLTASPLPAVRDLGLFTAAGLAGCLVLTIVGCTFALSWPACEPARHSGGMLATLAERLCRIGLRYRFATLAITGSIAAGAVAAGTALVVDTHTLDHIAAGHPVRRDSDFIEKNLAPYVPMIFIVRSTDGEPTAELLDALAEWQRAGEKVPGVGWSRSLADAMPRTDRGALDRPWLDAYRGSPLGRVDPLISDDGELSVTFSVQMQSAKEVARTMRALENAAQLPAGSTVAAAGYLPLYVRMIEHIVASQIASFTLAFFAVFAVIALALRSLPLAALALPSNLLPLLIILGTMGLLGIWLDAATVTIASVVLGLVVDDTVHFLHRLRTSLARHADRSAALIETARTAGRAILTTSAVMTAGFCVFALAEIKSVAYFGLLVALAMGTGALTDLLVLPALFSRQRKTQPACEIAYAQCWEDADILIEALQVRPGCTCLSIASAGDNTLALLAHAPRRVIAVDSNPAQIACLELRVSAYRNLSHHELLELIGSVASTRRPELYRRCRGGLSEAARAFWDARPAVVAAGIGSGGRFERYLRIFRTNVLPLVHPVHRVDMLLRGGNSAQRMDFHARRWDTWRWRAMFHLFFSRAVMSRLGRDPACFRYVNGSVASRLLARTRHGLTALDPAHNPYLQWICAGIHLTALPLALRPENFEPIRANLDRLEWRCCTLDEFLDNAAPQSIDCFNLSDVFEYMSPGQHRDSLTRLVRVAAPGARVVYWNMLVERTGQNPAVARLRPLERLARELHLRDKAFFYNSLVVEEVVP